MMDITLDPDIRIYAFGAPARSEDVEAFRKRYSEIPPGYLEIVEEMTGVVFLWKLRCELRLWGPEEAMGMDEAYGVSRRMPGAVPIGSNGGGMLVVHGRGPKGAGLYLVEAGALYFEDSEWIAPDLQALLERGEGAELVFFSDPLDEEAVAGAPFFEEGEYR
jgi:hypothetical protein